jgi:hypothetical protein
MKYKLVGATILAAFFCGVNPAMAVMVSPLTDRRAALSDPFGNMQAADILTGQDTSIAQGSGDSGVQEMAAKKSAKKTNKPKKPKQGKAS